MAIFTVYFWSGERNLTLSGIKKANGNQKGRNTGKARKTDSLRRENDYFIA